MFNFLRFLYSDNPDTGGGATENAPPVADALPEPVSTDQAKSSTASPVDTTNELTGFSADELKELGFDSLDALKADLKKRKEENISPEEKAKKANIDNAAFLKYSADNDLMKIEDYHLHENQKRLSDSDLVYSKFQIDHLEDNPEATPEEIKEAFNAEYKINHDNEKAKARGLSRIAKEAKEIRTPSESIYNSAKSNYDEYVGIRAKAPDFDKFIDDLVKEIAVDEFDAFKIKEGEEEIVVKGQITKEDRDNIAKMFKSNKNFSQFLSGKPDELKTAIGNKIRGVIRQSKMDIVQQKIWETAKGIGMKQGSNIGAENPYNRQQQRTETPVVSLEDSNRKIADARAKRR